MFLRKPVFARLFEIAEVGKLSKEERMDYERSLKIKWDNYATMEGMLEKGRMEEKRQAAREMKRLGLPVNAIVQVTKLSIEEIEKL